jgi:hypothetical protein
VCCVCPISTGLDMMGVSQCRGPGAALGNGMQLRKSTVPIWDPNNGIGGMVKRGWLLNLRPQPRTPDPFRSDLYTEQSGIIIPYKSKGKTVNGGLMDSLYGEQHFRHQVDHRVSDHPRCAIPVFRAYILFVYFGLFYLLIGTGAD